MSRDPLLDSLFRTALSGQASDVHLTTDAIPIFRDRDGGFVPLSEKPLTRDAIEGFTKILLSQPQQKILQEKGDVDASYTISLPNQEPARTRLNIFQDSAGISIAIRVLNQKIPKMQDLRLPNSVQFLTREKHGLILFSAPTGNGKTTSIASMLNEIVAEKRRRVITIEDPIEYVYHSAYATVSQREVGLHCKSFADGLHAALRENPDVILVGEMRDRDTIETALAAAETGHLVLSTLHTIGAAQTIDRIIDVCPAGERLTQYFDATSADQVRQQFANSFCAVIAQRLLPKNGGGRIAAFEVLKHTNATANVIRQGNLHMLRTYMTRQEGMIQMEESLQMLRQLRLIR